MVQDWYREGEKCPLKEANEGCMYRKGLEALGLTKNSIDYVCDSFPQLCDHLNSLLKTREAICLERGQRLGNLVKLINQPTNLVNTKDD